MSLLEQVKDPDSVDGWVDNAPYAYGASKMPLKFDQIEYSGFTPTEQGSITFQLLIKANRSDDDANAIIDATSFTITESPLVVFYALDTTTTGFASGEVYFGELWATDTTYGRNLIKEFRVDFSDPIKKDFQ